MGDENTEVLTENGLVPSVDKVLNDINTQADNVLASIQADADAAILSTGWFPAAGSFEAGGTITDRNQYLQLVTAVGADVAGGYSWGGALPKVVTAGSTPATAGGIVLMLGFIVAMLRCAALWQHLIALCRLVGLRLGIWAKSINNQ